MAVYLPHVLQSLTSRPQAMSMAQASMVVSALSGRLDIRSLETETTRMDARGMRDLAALGRMSADIAKSHKEGFQAAIMAPEQNPYTGLWNGKTFPQIGGIAFVQIWGVLTRTWGVGPYSGATGYDGIETQICDAMADNSVRGIWLNIQSGGGAVDGCFDLQELIYTMSARQGGKPIWAFASDYAYSSAYALGVAADRFILPQTGGCGSVGVLYLMADVQQAMEKEGVRVRIIRSGSKKALGVGGFEDIPEEELSRIQDQCDAIRDLFAERVGQYRAIAKSAVLQTEGLDYMGHQSVAIGFADEVLSEHRAWADFERFIA